MVFAEASLADVLATFPLEIEGGGVEEHQLQIGEEVPPVGEHFLLDPVLDAAGGERRLILLLAPGQLLAEPRHGPVQVMELQGLAPVDLIVGLPLVGRPVATGCEEAMEHRQEDGPLDVGLEPAPVEESLEDPLAPGLLPEALEDQGRSDAPGGDGGELALGVSGEEQDGLGQARAPPF